MSEKFLMTENVFRQCAVKKKMLPRSEMFRLVRTPEGDVFFDPEYKILGRGIHFSKNPEISAKFFHPKKKGMINHFLKAGISSERFEEIKKEVEKFFNSSLG